MTQTLDINGVLITSLGDRIPCKLTNISDRGYLELYSIDPVELNSRVQLAIITPRIQTAIKVTSVESSGDSWHIEALPEEGILDIKARIIEQKVRGIIK